MFEKIRKQLKSNLFLYIAIILFALFIGLLWQGGAFSNSNVEYDQLLVSNNEGNQKELDIDDDTRGTKETIINNNTSQDSAIRDYGVKLLSFDKYGISQEVIPVGIDHEGKIEVMNNAHDLVWYERKGENVKNIIIAGHQGWKKERGILNDSHTWEKGSELELTFENGTKETFVLTYKYKYKPDETPLELMSTEEGDYRVTVITCSVDGKERIYNVFYKK